MEKKYVGEIVFEGYKSFDTLNEVNAFKKELGDRYLRTTKCVYPDKTFYVVEYDTPCGYLKEATV